MEKNKWTLNLCVLHPGLFLLVMWLSSNGLSIPNTFWAFWIQASLSIAMNAAYDGTARVPEAILDCPLHWIRKLSDWLERLGNSENTMSQAEIKAKKCKRGYSPVRNYDQRWCIDFKNRGKRTNWTSPGIGLWGVELPRHSLVLICETFATASHSSWRETVETTIVLPTAVTLYWC